jgi:hypothetical protein
MNWVVWAVLGAVVVPFCWAVHAACRSWRTMGLKKRIAGLVLLAPHFMLIVVLAISLLLSLRCGVAPPGSRCFNAQFGYDVLVVFILPVPAIVGTVIALRLFRTP